MLEICTSGVSGKDRNKVKGLSRPEIKKAKFGTFRLRLFYFMDWKGTFNLSPLTFNLKLRVFSK